MSGPEVAEVTPVLREGAEGQDQAVQEELRIVGPGPVVLALVPSVVVRVVAVEVPRVPLQVSIEEGRGYGSETSDGNTCC